MATSSRFDLMRLALVLPVLLALALPAVARAKTRVQAVPGELVFLNAQRPTDPGNCSAVGFVRWKDVPRTVSARAFYLFKGKESSETKAPPFNDSYQLVALYTVLPGMHWINVTRSWGDGPGVNTCEASRVKLESLVTNPVRVELTVEIDPKECTAARTTAAKRLKVVNRLRARVRTAKGKEKARLRRSLTAAQTSHKTATDKVAELC